jgi:hypothetical protein
VRLGARQLVEFRRSLLLAISSEAGRRLIGLLVALVRHRESADRRQFRGLCGH